MCFLMELNHTLEFAVQLEAAQLQELGVPKFPAYKVRRPPDIDVRGLQHRTTGVLPKMTQVILECGVVISIRLFLQRFFPNIINSIHLLLALLTIKMPILPPSFFQEVEELKTTQEKFRWYTVLIVTLSSMNYPDEIPSVYRHFLSHYLPLIKESDRLLAARKIREALTKSVGIVGAAKVRFSVSIYPPC